MMHDFATGLHMTALGMGVVFVGLVLLAVAVRVTDLILNPRKGRRRRAGGVITPPRPAPGVAPRPAPAPAPAPAADAVDGEVVAAVAACLACVMGERGAGEARDVRIAPSLVAAVTAAIVAREEAGGGNPLSGRISIRVQKGALG